MQHAAVRVVHHHVVGDVRVDSRRQVDGGRVDEHAAVVVTHVVVRDGEQTRVLDVHRHDGGTRQVEDPVAAVLHPTPLHLHGRVQLAHVHEMDTAA